MQHPQDLGLEVDRVANVLLGGLEEVIAAEVVALLQIIGAELKGEGRKGDRGSKGPIRGSDQRTPITSGSREFTKMPRRRIAASSSVVALGAWLAS